TASAASSGTPRRRSAPASWALVLGAVASIRRQICRAVSSGSRSVCPARPAPAGSLPVTSPPPARASSLAAPIKLAGPAASPTGPAAAVSSLEAAAARPAARRLVATARQHLESGCRVGGAWATAAYRPRHIRVEASADAELLLDLLLDLV